MRIIQLNLNHSSGPSAPNCEGGNGGRGDPVGAIQEPQRAWTADPSGHAAVWVCGGSFVEEYIYPRSPFSARLGYHKYRHDPYIQLRRKDVSYRCDICNGGFGPTYRVMDGERPLDAQRQPRHYLRGFRIRKDEGE